MYVSILLVTDERSIQFREIQIFTGIQWLLFRNRENGHYNKKKFWRIYRQPMVTLPALRWSLMYTLLKFQGDPARESVWPKQCLFEAIFWLMLWHIRIKIFWVFWRIYRRPMVTQRHPPSPTKETAREHAWPKTVKVWCNSLAMLQPCRHTLIAE